jgi:hypothetical protein
MQIYPTSKTKRDIQDLKTIGIRLSREHAIHLARVLLAVTQEWDEVDLTGYRLDRRSDGTQQLTVTSARTHEQLVDRQGVGNQRS